MEFDKQTLDGLIKIKADRGLEEIAILTKSGKLVATTQKGSFKANESLYAIVEAAANQISELNNERIQGVTVETDKSEYFLHPSLPNTLGSTRQIIALQYPSGAIENGKRKEIIREISHLFCY